VASVYVFEIEDSAADDWVSQVAVLAQSQSDARSSLRGAGLHKRQIQNDGRPVRTLPDTDASFTGLAEGRFMRRRQNDTGWTAWDLLPAGDPLDWRQDPNAPTVR
jgi:hypothetical protein